VEVGLIGCLFFSPINLLLLAAITAVFRSLAESLLGGVDDVEEAVLVLLLAVQVRHWSGDGGQGRPVHQQEEGLVRMQLKSAPDYILQLADCDVVRDEELGLVQDGQLLLAIVPLNDDGHLGRVLLPDLLHVLHAESERSPLLECLLHAHRVRDQRRRPRRVCQVMNLTIYCRTENVSLC